MLLLSLSSRTTHVYDYAFGTQHFVDKGVMFMLLGCPSATSISLFVRPFVWTDLQTMMSHERLEQS